MARVEPARQDSPSVVIHNHNTYNISLYLSDKYPSALNLSDFLSRIVARPEDLKYTGDHGYVRSLCHVLIRELHAVGKDRRPIHSTCNGTNVYVKEDEEWGIDAGAVMECVRHVSRAHLEALSAHVSSGVVDIDDLASVASQLLDSDSSPQKNSKDSEVCQAVVKTCEIGESGLYDTGVDGPSSSKS